MKRRDFVKSTVVGAAAVSVAPYVKAENKKDVDLVAIYGGEPVEMYKKAIAAMGGIERFVKKGDKVVIKPNIGWDRGIDWGANTNPYLVGEVVKDCFSAGAKSVIVFDHTCGKNWQDRYKMSGIQSAVEAAGGQMVPGNPKDMFEEKNIPKGVSLKSALVHKYCTDNDVFINIPILKDHVSAKMTCAMKNYMGCIYDRQWWHKNDMPQCIADYCTFQKTTLTIVDAYRVMLTGGPRGKAIDDAPVAKYQIISTDIVAADVASAGIMLQVAKQHDTKLKFSSIKDLPYIELGEKLGVGTADLSKLNVLKLKV